MTSSTARQSIDLIRDSGLPISAVNLNVKGEPQWRQGSFTSPDPAVRAAAVSYMKTTMDLAAELGTDMVTCCTLIDGHNYSFEADYLSQWRWLEEGIAEAAGHRTDIKISLEYKPNESRNYVVLGDMGRTLYLCERVGLPHVGVTMDVGHALLAKETPAEMLAIAGQAQPPLLCPLQRQRARVGLGHVARRRQPVGHGRDALLPRSAWTGTAGSPTTS